MMLSSFILILYVQSVFSSKIEDEFEFCSIHTLGEIDCKNIKEINVFEVVDKCTDEIYISFKILNTEMMGFLNREGVIQEKSEEKGCVNELETFLSRDG